MTAYSRAVSYFAALLLFAGSATTTFATPMADVSTPKAQITILYDAFGKDSAMQKDWGYAALVDPEAAGYPLSAFVAIALDRPERRAAFLKKIATLPEVAECHHVAGDDDYLLKVRCRGTRDLDRLLVESLKSIPGVRTRTTIVLSTAKESVAIPLAEAE